MSDRDFVALSAFAAAACLYVALLVITLTGAVS
jgi:hypothetical protein